MEKIIDIKAIKFNPNLRILKNYFITYEHSTIKLFDLKGNQLDIIQYSDDTTRNINEIIIPIDNYLIIVFQKDIFIIKIKNNKFETLNYIIGKTDINNILYIKNNNLIVKSHNDNIEILDISNIYEKTIQVLNKESTFLFNFNKKIFVNCNYKSISFYQNIIGTKLYQLTSSIQLYGKKQIFKLNKKTLMVLLNDKNIYAIKIKKMKISEIKLPFKTNSKIDFIYNNDKNFYLFVDNVLYYVVCAKNEFQLINSFKINKLKAINYIINKYMKINKLKFNCTENLSSNYPLYMYPDIYNIKRNSRRIHYEIRHLFCLAKDISEKINCYKNQFEIKQKIIENETIDESKTKKKIIKNEIIRKKSKKKSKIKRKIKINYNKKKEIFEKPNNFKKKFR